MRKYILTFALIIALMLAVGAVMAVEEEGDHDLKIITPEDETPFAMFVDGRLNAYDVAAPVVVFYTYAHQPLLDENGIQAWDNHGHPVWQDVVTGIEVLAVNQVTGGTDLVLNADLASIREAIESAGQDDCCLLENGPYSLHYSQSGRFWVEAPFGDGKTYSFDWQALEF
jgi:hypothetical protein